MYVYMEMGHSYFILFLSTISGHILHSVIAIVLDQACEIMPSEQNCEAIIT